MSFSLSNPSNQTKIGRDSESAARLKTQPNEGQIVLGRKRSTIRTDIFAPSWQWPKSVDSIYTGQGGNLKPFSFPIGRDRWLHAAANHPSTSTSTTGALWSPNKACRDGLAFQPLAVTVLPSAFIRTGPCHNGPWPSDQYNDWLWVRV